MWLSAQLSVEVNGSLVGDSPYLVMFEVDDGAELQPDDEDGTANVTGKVCVSLPRACSSLHFPYHQRHNTNLDLKYHRDVIFRCALSMSSCTGLRQEL